MGAFDPRLGRWFNKAYGQPSQIQAAAWPAIAAGRHVLMTAPTGSGKTLAAFLWALERLLTGAWSGGQPRVLYVSPLKALNTDVRRNLLAPLEALLPRFRDKGGRQPVIRVLTRSGDTPQSERRGMLRQPPEILITTPESLNLLLNSRGGQSLLGGLKTVILDEIHAVAGSKRGTHLITAVERLVPLSGEFQRVALSATVQPLAAVADFVGGYALAGTVEAPVYVKRPVEIIPVAGRKAYRVKIHYPAVDEAPPKKDSVWEPLADTFHAKARRNTATLIFTNGRKLTEKMAYLVNAAAGELLAYAHHGSLARNLREQVEARLKRGELKAVFATSSLELGIDIGDLDEVALLQTPPTISSAVQRAGRAGHQVGAASHASIYCTHPGDLVPAAVMGRAVVAQDIEPLTPVKAPLDVLAQVLVGMVALAPIDRRDLYHRIRCASPYHDLGEAQFDGVLEMLTGRNARTRVRDLKARVAVDAETGMVQARKGALQALYFSGGTIPDRGYYTLRHDKGGTRIGELDEEFVWEAKTGQVFTLGTQNWQIRKVTASDVFVRPAPGNRAAPPFWKADGGGRDAHFAARIAEFLEWIDERLDVPELAAELQADYHLDPPAAERLIVWLRRQRRLTGCSLPHRRHLLVEHIHSGPGGAPGSQLVIHLPWGGRVNRPLALALEAAMEDAYGQAPEVFAGDDLILVVNPPEVDTEGLLSLVDADRLLPLLRRRLEGSGFFGARFRTAAGRALLLTRGGLKRRMPLWMTRLKAQKLMTAVKGFEDFPLMLEAWRSCLQDGFDLSALEARLAALEAGEIEVSTVTTTTPSPMAQTAAWGQINDYMYRDDSAREDGRSNLQEDLLREVIFSQKLRPQVDPEVVATFEEKRQRTATGYAPSDALELVEWIRDRLLLPWAEWERLLDGMTRDHGVDRDALLGAVAGRLVRLVPPEDRASAPELVTTREAVPILLNAFWEADASPAADHLSHGSTVSLPPLSDKVDVGAAPQPEVLLSQWLSYYGPITLSWAAGTLGTDRERLSPLVASLLQEAVLIHGALLTTDGEERICDAENYDILLRLGRAQRRRVVQALPLADLPLLLAQHQGVGAGEGGAADADTDGPTRVAAYLAQLSGWPAGAAQWEAELLPARLPGYQPAWLDAVLQEGELIWRGCGPQRLTFCYHDELDLLSASRPGMDAEKGAGGKPDGEPIFRKDDDLLSRMGNPSARYPFASLVGDAPRDRLYDRIWQAVWAGGLVNDGYQAVRQGVANRFRWPAGVGPGAGSGRLRRRSAHGRHLGLGGRSRQLNVPGNWYRPEPLPPHEDELAALETDKERVRLLLGRYGVLFRSLVSRELEAFSWTALFRALRLMELAGEVVGGHFIEGAPGPQFISRKLQNTLVRGLDRETIFFLSAADPSSVCGLGLDWEGAAESDRCPKLPARRSGTHLVYHGNRLVMISRRQGRRLTFSVGHDDKNILKYIEVIDHILTYRANVGSAVVIEAINEGPAPASPYLDPLRTRFEVDVAPNGVTVYRPWTS